MSISLDLEENSLFKESKDEKKSIKTNVGIGNQTLDHYLKVMFSNEKENCWYISF